MWTDTVTLNAAGGWEVNGEVAQVLHGSRFETGLRRIWHKNDFGTPYCKDPRPYVTVNTGRYNFDRKLGRMVPIYRSMPVQNAVNMGIPVANATLGLRKLEWELLDQAVVLSARNRLRAWADLAASSTYSVPGMSKTMLEYEQMSDPGEAVVDMDARTDGRADTPIYSLQGLPLPITHSDFNFGARELTVSRNAGQGLDLRMAEAAGRRVAEKIEQTLIGTVAGMQYTNPSNTPTYSINSGTPKVFGYTNFPNRQTYTSVTTPTGANPQATLSNVLAMIQLLRNTKMFGPYMIYHSRDWDTYLDNDYAFTNGTNWATNPNMTLRDRLRKIDGIVDVRRLDFWDPTLTGNNGGFQLLVIQMTSEVARAVVGMDITTVQWPTKGGLQENFKVMTIMVPQLRSDYSGNCGICHGTTS